MNRCVDCAGELYGAGTQCAMCRNREWMDQQAQRANMARTRQIMQDINAKQSQKERQLQSAMTSGFLFAVTLLVFWAFVNATRVAVDYEIRKPEILKAHGVQ